MMTTKKSTSAIKLKYFLSMPVMVIALVLLAINVNSCSKAESASNGGSVTDLKSGNTNLTSQVDTTDIQDPVTKTWQRIIVDQSDTTVYNLVEVMPMYKTGNMDDFILFIQQNIVYPKSAKDNNVTAKIYVHFVVQRDGRVDDVTVVKSEASQNGKLTVNATTIADLNAEAIRVVKSLPAFIPGKQAGKNVMVQFVVPIKFALEAKAGKVQ